MHKIAIFASGSGTNAENIVKRFHDGNYIRVAVVLSDHADAGVHERMQRLGVESITLPAEVWRTRPGEVIDLLEERGVELVALAGFLKKVHPALVEMYEGRMLNIHPSLLPLHGGKGMYGHKVHEDVLACGDKESGATVHYVTNEMDKGEILLQGRVPVLPGDTAHDVEMRVRPVEFDIFPRAIMMAFNRMELEAERERLRKEQADNSESAVPREAVVTGNEPLSRNEQWARTLKVDYSDAEAQRRRDAASIPPPMPEHTTASQEEVRVAPKPAAEPQREPMPPTWMVWSIVMTLACCFVPGVVAIVYSSQVAAKYQCGDIQGAWKASKRAEAWIIASFVLGVLSATLYLPYLLITA